MKTQFVYRDNGEIVERGKVVNVLSVERGWFRTIDDMGDDCLIPPSSMVVVDPNPPVPTSD